MKQIKIGNRWVGENKPVFIIAEVGVNHNGDVRLAKRMIDIASDSGADAVKFQSFKTKNIMTRLSPSAEYHRRAVRNRESWFNLLRRLEFKEKEQISLFNYCSKKGIIFLSTPYDEESADFLNKLNVCAFKISSTDLNNIPLLKNVACYGKPIILSTGMSVLNEIGESIISIKEEGNQDIILLQCTSNYPPNPEDINLNVLDTLRREFDVLVGFSDHFASPQTAIAAVAKGSCIYEVHFTLDRNMEGPDHKSSVDPAGLKDIISNIRLTERLLGSNIKEVTPSERETERKLKKSIVAIANIKMGEVLTKNNIGIKRPGTGLPPRYFYDLIGKVVKRDIAKDELIRLIDIRAIRKKMPEGKRIRGLTRKDVKKLTKFLLGLTEEVFCMWNRFGFSLGEFDPQKAALEVCNSHSLKEKGFICLDSGGSIVAYSYLRFFPAKKTKRHNASLGIVVHPKHQGSGIGEEMLVFMHKWAKANGIKKIWLGVYASNRKAIRLHKKLGYQIEGIFMYDELGRSGWEHVISMAIMLDNQFKNAVIERRKLVKEIDNLLI